MAGSELIASMNSETSASGFFESSRIFTATTGNEGSCEDDQIFFGMLMREVTLNSCSGNRRIGWMAASDWLNLRPIAMVRVRFGSWKSSNGLHVSPDRNSAF